MVKRQIYTITALGISTMNTQVYRSVYMINRVYDCALGRTREPMAPLPGVGMNAMRAVSAVRTLHEGCQCSGWWLLIDRQTCEEFKSCLSVIGRLKGGGGEAPMG